MEAVLKKWGNSAAIRLPSTIIKACQLRVNQAVEIAASEGKIVISRRSKPSRYKLSALIAGINQDNLHEVVDFGKPVGNESL